MCTRILWNDNGVANAVSRCMDWAVTDEPELWFVPRGTARSGGDAETALEWVSAYSSFAVSMWGVGTVDGLNEKGLAAHALYLEPEDNGGAADDGRPSVAHTLWAQYLLDTFATVAEAVAAIDDVRIAFPPLRGEHLGIHIAIEDASGDSAIIEPIDGELVVHHGPEHTVMTNSPPLDQQLENLARYRPFGGELPPPGDITSRDRFVRASYFLHYLPAPASAEQAMAGVFQLISNVSVPFGAPYDDGGVYPTWWHSGADLTHGTYYFGATDSPSIFWLDLDAQKDGREVLRLDPRDPSLVGEASARFEPATLRY
ncbi:linear amide C-N hydrolase [Microbacterium sp. X-17]|uniref:linear amide C-N hydrolase n=1 Tax=Microbacterium sp. X-17 TaxID=3144404 RepID=UPI0031F5B943